MTIDLAKEHEIRRLHDVEKWKRGTIVAELGVHAYPSGRRYPDAALA